MLRERSSGNNQAEVTRLMENADSSFALIGRAQSGDRDAFEELVRVYGSRGEGLIVSRLRAHHMTNVTG